MSQIIEVKVPDIGDFKDVPIIELHVKPGDRVAAEDALITLESDKATMDVPAPAAGLVKSLAVKLGDTVSEGSVVLTLEAGEAAAATEPKQAPAAEAAPVPQPAAAAPASAHAAASLVAVAVPDIGDYTNVPIIELHVKPGDTIQAEDPVATLESDKATMDVPSSASGTVREVRVKLGDAVSMGSVLIMVETGAGAPAAPAVQPPSPQAAPGVAPPPPLAAPAPVPASPAPAAAPTPPTGRAHASPSVRRFARELGVDVSLVKGTGPKGRIQHGDVQAWVKATLQSRAAPAGGVAPGVPGGVVGGGTLNLLPWPQVDFNKFGPIETRPLSRIKKLSAQNLARNWVMIPAVTYHEDADITELEAFRVQFNKENEKTGAKVTMLAFLIKAVVAALKKFPEFNSSLTEKDGEMSLVLKQYFHVAFAADTPNGLVVPVVKDADKKGIVEIAAETAALAKKARDGKLAPTEMQGACFTISSLGGIGGTYFAPIINAPEVAILGVNKSAMKPVWDGQAFVPRLTLPLSLTADHRVIDGAAATRFNVYVAELLADMRRVLM